MEKQLYWLVKNNGNLSVTIQDINKAKEIIEADFKIKSEMDGEGIIYYIEDWQYTITPKMLTQEEYVALGEA